MNGKFLIDTNIIIKLMARDPTLRWRMGHDFRCFICFISIGELYSGVHQSTKKSFNAAGIEHLCSEIPILFWDIEVADTYGRIHSSLRRRGKPIPENDIWIAATALRYEMTLITLDKHFNSVEGLLIESW